MRGSRWKCRTSLGGPLVGRPCHAGIARSASMHIPEPVQTAMTYFVEHACRGGTIAEAARCAGVSVPQLSRLFGRHLGKTPTRIMLEVRVKAASELLATGVPAVRAARRAGFSDQAHMIRVFRRLLALTPAQFVHAARKNVQEKSEIIAHTPRERRCSSASPSPAGDTGRRAGSRCNTYIGRNAGKEEEG